MVPVADQDAALVPYLERLDRYPHAGIGKESEEQQWARMAYLANLIAANRHQPGAVR